jgi:predicted esterase
MRVCFLVLLAACGSNATSLPVEAHCNPLGANHCMTPWPSSAFEVDDPTTETGRRLAIPDKTLPKNIDDLETDPTGWNVADGFSPSAPMVMAFPGGVSSAGLPPVDNMDLSLAADSPTVILDMTTGTRVAHFAEVDVPAEATPDSQALFLRPAARLISGHRYAVAITNRVVAKDGSDLPVPRGFAALRDGKHTDHALLEAMRPRFEDVLVALDDAGFPAGELVVAWDFTVASDKHIHSDMIAARDRALAALASHPIEFTILTDAAVDDGSIIKRRITGTLDAPLFLSNGGAAQPGTRIVRDASGLPAVQGFYRIPFTAIVPTCASTAPTAVPMIIYGHGLLGDSTEAAGGVQRTTANELCMVIVGTDMRGMSEMDLPAVARALNEISKADELFEVIEQGMVNHITLVQAMRTVFAQQLFVDGPKKLVDPARVFYYGLSQGAIMGTTVMAYEPTITRGVLGVGAANYSMLLERSLDWPTYRTILSGAYPDSLDVTLAINLFQMRWDKVEGAGVANSVREGAPTGVPPKQILLQIAIGDEQVPNVGSYWMARTMGLPILGPSPITPWGLTVQDSPLPSGSALVIMDGGAPAPPTTNIPATDLHMHSLTRNQPAARRQIKEFFNSGQIINECSGACVCTPTCL